MEEIKFRGLSVKGEWHYGLLSIAQGGVTQPEKGYYISNSAGSPWAYRVRPETVGQYTGRKGKNDVEIYKGDIVKAVAEERFADSSHIGEIVCNEGTDFGEWQVSRSKDSKMGLGIGWGGWESLEVIGNIYEDKNLLDK